MKNDLYDIAVTGGGLAGLTLAIQAADAGYAVVLFEKETYPFHKVCGEYISMESRHFLLRCGVPLAEWDLPQIHQLQVSDTEGKEYAFDLPLGGFGVSRYKLDHALYQIALQKGVTIFTDCKVTDIFFEDDQFSIHTAQGNHTAKTAAGCFGKKSNLDVKWKRGFTTAKPGKINNFVGVKYHIKYPHAVDAISLHNFIDGYCGISRIENEECCLCYLTTAKNLAQSGNSIERMEHEILSKNKKLQQIFSEAVFIYKQPLTISQISFEQKTQVENHTLMLGDAAGMITPLCGNGMSMAMHSSKIAFENIQAFLSGRIDRGQMESGYTREWKKQFAQRTRIGRVVQSFFGGSLSTAVFLRLMHAFPVLSRNIIKQTHGKNILNERTEIEAATMKQIFFILFIVCNTIFAVAQNYTPVDTASRITVVIKNVGMEVEGKFSGLEGFIVFNPADLKSASFSVSVDAASINTGIEPRDIALRSAEYLNADNAPKISFISKQITQLNKAAPYIMKGTVTVRGISKDIMFPFTVVTKNDGLLFTGEMRINRSDFKIAPGSTVLSNSMLIQLSVFAKK